MTVKFLFINAINEGKDIETRYPPLGIGYLISSLRKRFGKNIFEFRLVTGNVEKEIENFKPDIVGISSVSQNYGRAVAYAALAKKLKIPVLCGGVHITMLPGSLSTEMDAGVLGEGEETVCELLQVFLNKKCFKKNDLCSIKGIVYWDGVELRETPQRDLISPLDKLPFPAREFFTIKNSTYLFSSRGCPYRCTFCVSSRFWDKVRMFSAAYVAEEIEFLVKQYGVTELNFYDDIFSVNIERIKALIKVLKEKNILGKIKIVCSIRANLVNDGTISLLKEIGVTSVGIGFESGSEEILKYLKLNVKISDNENAVRITQEHGMQVYGSFIIGSPGEEKKDILETFKFIKRSRLAGFNLYVLTPFPGTPVWGYALSKGLVSEQMNWDKLNVDFGEAHESAIILSDKLSRSELYGLYRKIMRYKKSREFMGQIKAVLLDPGILIRAIIKRIKLFSS